MSEKTGDRMPRPRCACLISARNLGDAVIQSGVLQDLARRGYAERYLVWTRPQVAFLFESIPNCTVVSSEFPVGTSKQMGGAAVLRFLKAVWRIRRIAPDATMDLFGDFRERLFARMIGSARHVYIGWELGHPFARLIRNPWGAGRPACVVPTSVPNVYEAYQLFVDRIAPAVRSSEPTDRVTAQNAPESGALMRVVGVHPFASGPWKVWPASHWVELVDRLLGQGVQVTAFGAPGEHAALATMFAPLAEDRVRMITGSIPAFVCAVERLDLLVGLDSFSIHVAARAGIAAVMINGANNPATWAPPGSSVLASSGGCPHWPCYSKPRCEGTALEYACIRSIPVADVFDAVVQRLDEGGTLPASTR